MRPISLVIFVTFTSGSIPPSTETFFIQLQGYKLAHCLIDFMPQPLLTAETYTSFLDIVKETVPEIQINPQLKEAYSKYENQNKNLYVKQLHAMFKFPELKTFAEYSNDLPVAAKLQWICQHIKKPKDIWLAYNMLEKYLDNTYLQSGFQKQDATSSAIQFIGTLQNNYKVCVLSNITGRDYTDVYSQYLKLFIGDVDQIINFCSTTHVPLLAKYSRGNSAEQLVFKLVMNNAAWESLINDPKYTELTLIMKDELIVQELSAIQIPGVALTRATIAIIDPVLKAISGLRDCESCAQLLSMVPRAILNNRNITKPVIMTVGYNAGETAFIKGIFDYLYDALCSLGQPAISKYHLLKLSALVYRLLHPHITQTLKEVTSFSHYMSNHVKEKLKANPVPLTINTPFIMWTHAKYDITVIVRNEIKSVNPEKKSTRFAIFQIGGMDVIDTETSFASIFVHSCDAFVVHDVMNNIRKINEKCHAVGLPVIGVVFNHDCFTISAQHAALLQSLVRLSYNKAYIMRKQIPALDKLTGNRKQILCTNPNFLRY